MDLDRQPARLLVVIDAVGVRERRTAPALLAVAACLRRSDPVDVAIVVHADEEPDALDAAAVLGHLGPAPLQLPEVELVSAREVAGRHVHLRLDVDDERAGARLEQLVQSLPDPAEAPAALDEVHQLRAAVASAAQDRDVRRQHRPDDEVTIAVVVQHQPTWGAVETVCAALRGRSGVRLVTVAVDSEHDGQRTSTAEFLRSVGHRPVDAGWLRSNTDEVDVVVFDNPYDALRPEGLRSVDVASAGVRLAYLPYGNNVGEGADIKRMQYDLDLHRLAWRVYARSEQQAEMYARYCAAGRAHVRVLGMPKLDRVVSSEKPAGLERLRRHAAGRTVFLWNPHFSIHSGGWSTFLHHLDPLLAHFAEHPERFLLVRPHFRLLRDLRLSGGAAAALGDSLRERVRSMPNVSLDRTPDYKAAFAVADALLSDASSLVTEFLPTGRPVLYLHRVDGPGINEDAAYFDDLDRAETWLELKAFLDRVSRGEDPRREHRAASVARHIGQVDGRAGARIADDLVMSLVRERNNGTSIPFQPLGGAA